MKVEIGINEEDRQAIAEGLSRLLADSYTLYLKTHNYHWNVTGPQFNTLHTMFEGQYTELAIAVDQIAERIRALGIRAPGSYRQFAKLTCIDEAEGGENAEEMIRQLVIGQETVVRTARAAFPAADEAHDEPTADLLTQRMQAHEKNAWMLRSMLEDQSG
ncbi:MAG: DNA starvation/stationary phase protection protein [Gammaproteobacteria bacterium]|nr:DNA starvation/stationary phase protection protein [Gammaproteobacteria bacterium]